MALGPRRGSEQAAQIEMVCLDELVPADNLYRRLDELINWGFVRTTAAPSYAGNVGRPSIDPIVLVKLMLAGALEGCGSMRALLRSAALRLDLRRFLGYGLAERLPAHQTISEAHTLRFAGSDLFERLFSHSVALCAEADLLEGTHLSIDGFHAEANAALASLRASLGPVPPERSTTSADATLAAPAQTPAASQLTLAEPHKGRTPARRSANANALSRSDPDARLRGKPGQRPHLVLRGQVAVDPRARVIVAVRGERADTFEGEALAELPDRARFCAPRLESIAADRGYAARAVWEEAAQRGLLAYVPPRRNQLPRPDTKPTTAAQRLALQARRRCRSAAGIWAHARRLADAEGAIAELKGCHALGRARRRGKAAFHEQLLIGAAALNLKRLARCRDARNATAVVMAAAAPSDARHVVADGAQSPQTGGFNTRLTLYLATIMLCWN